MRHKLIFTGIVIALFIVSTFFAYYGGGAVREGDARISEQMKKDFVAPGVPKSVTAAFSRQFERLAATTEVKLLPETPLTTMDGKTVTIVDFAGRPTLVNLWARWCTPCVVELPSLEKLAKHYDGKMNVVAVAIEAGATEAEIAHFLEKRRIGNFAGYLDKSGDFARSLGIQGIPTSFLIGSDGLILYRFDGDADWTGPDSQAFFDIFLLQNR